MEIYCTICSKEKRETLEKIPAIKLYTNSRLKEVQERATKSGKPFYILSGRYGIIAASEKINWYDKKLTHKEVEKLLEIVLKQLKDITKIVYFYENEEGWEPYTQLLEEACLDRDITLKKILL